MDRTLILQQAKLQPDEIVSLDAKRRSSCNRCGPTCRRARQYHCETEAGWEKFVHDQGFTMDELVIQRWQQRMEILKFHRAAVSVRALR